jgi:beta-glucanase (GH16 family)
MTFSHLALAVSSAELYTATSYPYGRFEARARLAAGDGVVSSFFLWKDGSERAGAFWNELDFEKLGAECRLETNPIYGKPSANHSKRHALALDLCGAFHSYVFIWTPEALVWLVDAVEIRRETGAAAQAFTDNALPLGMQIHLNLWPGNATFGGNFSPGILPVHQYVDWVEYSTYEDGAFTPAWREDFDGDALPEGWLTGSWGSPKNLSTHAPENVNFIDGYAVLSLTADDALGPAGAMPEQGAAGAEGSSTGTPNATGGSTNAGGPNPGASSGSSPSDGACSFGHAPRRARLLGALGVVAVAWSRRPRSPSNPRTGSPPHLRPTARGRAGRSWLDGRCR